MIAKLKKLSKARYYALTYSVDPLAQEIIEEIDWYSDENEKLIGILVRDRIDKDWGYIIMGRDEAYLFKCIDTQSSIRNINLARKNLKHKLKEYSRDDNLIYVQENGVIKKKDIFKTEIPDNKLNHLYLKLINNTTCSPAKEIIREIAYSFVDCDGDFFKEFQTSGFNARLWELYLYAFLHEEHCRIDRTYNSPDFLCQKLGKKFFIEATTTQPSDNKTIDDINRSGFSIKEVEAYDDECLPIRVGSALKKKLNKKYWEKPHVSGNPLIIAIQNFCESNGAKNNNAIAYYVYGIKIFDQQEDSVNCSKAIIQKNEYHKYKDRSIKSGFFFLSNAENISAVLFSNSATIAKFNRMGKLAGFGDPRITIERIGLCYDPNPDSTTPITFYALISPEEYEETWGQGLAMYHNPRAIHPVDPNLFPNITHYFYVNNELTVCMPDGINPISSITLTSIVK